MPDTPARPRVLLLHSILEPGPALLAEAAEVVAYPSNLPLTDQNIRKLAEGCAGIVSQVMDPISELVLQAPGLKIVSNVAVGYDNICGGDVSVATRHGVMVTNTPGVLDETTADFAWALMFAVARRVVQADNFVRGGHFKGWAIDMLLGVDLHQATLGIVGIGRIGRAVARRARGFDMRVLYSDPNPLLPDVERTMGVTRVDLPQLLAESDIVTLHVPGGTQTEHLIGAPQLAMMRPTAILINTSRGVVVDEAALADALKNHRLFGAGLDVYEREPAVHQGLLAAHNAVLAPHIASGSIRTRAEMSAVAARNCVTGIRGGRPANLLNPEVLSKR
ncbi:MAG TPA: D-glycerate dehydrogenase [Candidatus Acidoferrales bacterium]|nr:D-glycerate dehydrogenase [Candidatus Acidoferrales bacterium]